VLASNTPAPIAVKIERLGRSLVASYSYEFPCLIFGIGASPRSGAEGNSLW